MQYSFLELSLVREQKSDYSKLYLVNSSFSLSRYFHNFWASDIDLRERFRVVFLNHRNKVIGSQEVGVGGFGGVVVDARLVFSCALLAGASAIAVCHNHPSGETSPSQADRVLTNKLSEAGKFLDIRLLDHIIITEDKDKYFSFADSELLKD